MPYKDQERRTEYHREYHKGWYQRNKEKVIEKRKQRQLDIRDWFRSYKSKLCCIECGESHPACLQFHHKNKEEKRFNISDVARRPTSMKALVNEIEKCDVLCVNCHAKHHWREKYEFDSWEDLLGSEEGIDEKN